MLLFPVPEISLLRLSQSGEPHLNCTISEDESRVIDHAGFSGPHRGFERHTNLPHRINVGGQQSRTFLTRVRHEFPLRPKIELRWSSQKIVRNRPQSWAIPPAVDWNHIFG